MISQKRQGISERMLEYIGHKTRVTVKEWKVFHMDEDGALTQVTSSFDSASTDE